MPATTRRLVYIDLGVAYGDTLDLYEALDHRPQRRASAYGPWEIYGFEASPKRATYLERLFRFKNGVGERPKWCYPPVGSTHDRMRFAARLGCDRTTRKEAMVWKSVYCLNRLVNARPAPLQCHRPPHA